MNNRTILNYIKKSGELTQLVSRIHILKILRYILIFQYTLMGKTNLTFNLQILNFL
jgi:hypothetical protein